MLPVPEHQILPTTLPNLFVVFVLPQSPAIRKPDSILATSHRSYPRSSVDRLEKCSCYSRHWRGLSLKRPYRIIRSACAEILTVTPFFQRFLTRGGNQSILVDLSKQKHNLPTLSSTRDLSQGSAIIHTSPHHSPRFREARAPARR